MGGQWKAMVDAKVALASARGTIKDLKSARGQPTELRNTEEENAATRRMLEEHSELLAMLRDALGSGRQGIQESSRDA